MQAVVAAEAGHDVEYGGALAPVVVERYIVLRLFAYQSPLIPAAFVLGPAHHDRVALPGVGPA